MNVNGKHIWRLIEQSFKQAEERGVVLQTAEGELTPAGKHIQQLENLHTDVATEADADRHQRAADKRARKLAKRAAQARRTS